MKTPNEIKKGLQCNEIDHCSECPYDGLDCAKHVDQDALAYTQQLEADNESKQKRIDELESRLAQVERERDTALSEWKRTKLDSEGMCWTCKHGLITSIGSCRCVSPDPCDEGENWEWRGFCSENKKEE